MQITNFTISPDRTELNIIITDAADVETLLLWTDSTYKNYNEAIDLSSFLTGSATEEIVLTLSDLELEYFDGIYFIEADDSSEVFNAITSDLTRYKECILDKIKIFTLCDDCLKKESIAVMNAQALLRSLEDAIEFGFINELITILKALKIYCSNTCKTCGEYKNIENVTYYSTNQDD